MSDGENALYADSRLVDLYDLLNQGDWDYAFYSEQIGKQRRKVLDLVRYGHVCATSGCRRS